MPRKDRIVLIALAAAAIFITTEAAPAHAKIYKSIDKDGHVTYSNVPIPGATKTAVLDNPPAPSEEDVRAAQEAYKSNEAFGAEMEKKRLQLEEQRALLDMKQRLYEDYLQQARTPVLDDNARWVFPNDPDAHRSRFNRSLRMHDGKRHEPHDRTRVGKGNRQP
jgi:hypothetical protein